MRKLLRWRAPLLVSLLAWPLVAHALDLTPIPGERELEGFRIRTLSFQDGESKVRYQPPGGWRVTGSPNLLSLYPGQQGAFMQVRLLARAPAMAPLGDGPASEDLIKWLRGFLPPDATEIALADQRLSPFTLNGQPSRELIYTYNASGQRLTTSVAVCDLDERQRIVVIVTAQTADFKAIHEAGIASLFSWSVRK